MSGEGVPLCSWRYVLLWEPSGGTRHPPYEELPGGGEELSCTEGISLRLVASLQKTGSKVGSEQEVQQKAVFYLHPLKTCNMVHCSCRVAHSPVQGFLSLLLNTRSWKTVGAWIPILYFGFEKPSGTTFTTCLFMYRLQSGRNL